MNIIKTCFRFRIGKGAISLWYAKWFDDDYLCHLVPYVHIQDTHIQVPYIFFDDYWHWNLLPTSIHMDVRMQSFWLDGVTEDVSYLGEC